MNPPNIHEIGKWADQRIQSRCASADLGYGHVLRVLHHSGATFEHPLEKSQTKAAAKNATVFIVFRSILGAVESGFAPGMIAFLPYWYTREEVGFR
ncbi:hypothetical protein AX774_g5989, partial [Zancudomyces culisetae]